MTTTYVNTDKDVLRTNTTIEELSDFLAGELQEVYSIGNFDGCHDFIDELDVKLSNYIEDCLIRFAEEHQRKQ